MFVEKATKSNRVSDEDFTKRLLHTSSSSGSNLSGFGNSNLLPTVTMTVDEITSQKLDKLMNQNDKVMVLFLLLLIIVTFIYFISFWIYWLVLTRKMIWY